MEKFSTVVKSQFRIVIPKNVRESLGLKIDDKVKGNYYWGRGNEGIR
jgi:AbrB family looped-hinge helix DNA binding protein